jgi:hypothetical protein
MLPNSNTLSDLIALDLQRPMDHYRRVYLDEMRIY